MTIRTIDPEHNWFWRQGYRDGLAGRRGILPDEARRLYQRGDYFRGYDAGDEDRAAKAESESDEE